MAHDKYLDLLTEMVLTDHKTVTCSSLCDILDVDPNLSKRMIYHFWDENKDNVAVTYLISGLRNGVLSVLLRNSGDDFEFDKVVSKYIYSVGPSSPGDSSLLYNLDKIESRKTNVTFISQQVDNPIQSEPIKNESSTVEVKSDKAHVPIKQEPKPLEAMVKEHSTSVHPKVTPKKETSVTPKMPERKRAKTPSKTANPSKNIMSYFTKTE